MKNLFTRVFVGEDIDKLQNQVNQWVEETEVMVADYKHQMAASEFEGYPFVLHSIMVVYEAAKSIPVQESSETEESHELELVATEDDDLPF